MFMSLNLRSLSLLLSKEIIWCNMYKKKVTHRKNHSEEKMRVGKEQLVSEVSSLRHFLII